MALTQAQKNERAALRRQNTILKNKNKELKDREDFINAIDTTKLKDLKSLTVTVNNSKKEEVLPISTLSDAHVDEVVQHSAVNGLNEYNPDIATYRINTYFKRLLYLLIQQKKAGYTFDTVVIGLIGDFVSGYIHEELEETNIMTPPEATMFAQDLLAAGIKTIANSGIVKKIIIPCTPGNHGRTTKRKRFATGFKNSYEYMMFHNLDRMFKLEKGYEHVEFKIAESEFLYLDLFGRINMFSHGDHFRYQGGVGGIEVPLKKFILRETSLSPFGKLDMSWMGHWHQYISLNKVRINGSVIGYNAYARSFGFEPEPPRMQFQLLDKKRGYTLNNPIYLTNF